MGLNILSSYLPLFQKQVRFSLFKQCIYRDSDFAKQVTEAFKQLEKKQSKRISVNALNAKLSEEHLLPTMVIQDRSSGEIITQLFNFVDHFSSKQQVTMENVEKLLRNRGILEPQGGQQKVFDNKKEEQEYVLSVGSSYLQDSLNNDELEQMNRYLEESEKVQELVLDARTVNYKHCLLESFKQVQDPFKIEIDDINFDQNPNDPSQLQMNIKFINQKYQQNQQQ